MTSNQHGPYVRGYTRVTMAGTERRSLAKWIKSLLNQPGYKEITNEASSLPIRWMSDHNQTVDATYAANGNSSACLLYTSQRPLSFSYRKPGEKVEEYKVFPISVIFDNHYFYCISYKLDDNFTCDYQFSEIRYFRVDLSLIHILSCS